MEIVASMRDTDTADCVVVTACGVTNMLLGGASVVVNDDFTIVTFDNSDVDCTCEGDVIFGSSGFDFAYGYNGKIPLKTELLGEFAQWRQKKNLRNISEIV